MEYQWLNLGLAFVEGFALIASPCVLVVLPIVIAGALAGQKRTLVGMMIGFVCLFSLATLLTHYLVQNISMNSNLLRMIGFIFILGFGVVLVSDKLSQRFSRYAQRIADIAHIFPNPRQDGFWAGIGLGASLALIWTPCAGPILASAIVQSAVQKTWMNSVVILFFFASGAILPMALIALGGKWIFKQVLFLKSHAWQIRKGMGVVIILSALVALYGGRLPQYIPMHDAPNLQIPQVKHPKGLIAPLLQPYPAPPLQGIETWLNSSPLTIAQLKGKVVLIDFWTYSCINCIRTLPELERWYAQYHDKGLEIIGVHTPEFEFEKNPKNVERAIGDYHITYPVALDNHYGTWISYHNQYWPAQYLIDQNGMVVYQKFGEGNGDIMEHNILTLLNMPSYQISIGKNHTAMNNQFEALQTREIYLGYLRSNAYGGAMNIVANAMSEYAMPFNLAQDTWAISGFWEVNRDRIVSGKLHPSIQLRFFAGKVYAVMGSESENPIHVKVFFNDSPIGDKGGKDVKDSTLIVNQYGLYELVHLPEPDVGVLTLQSDEPDLAIYTFTFG